MAELTVAIIGCGAVGNVHLACWSNLIGVRVSAVCDVDGITAARTAGQMDGTAAFTETKALMEAQRYDIVDVCTPAGQQYEAVRAALLAGANVLCETPFTGDPGQARHLVQLAGERERLLMPGFCHRFHPPILFARELLDNDDLGHATMFRCRYSGLRTDEDLEARGLIQSRDPQDLNEARSGVLLETAIHGVDLYRAFMGEATAVSGRLLTVNPQLVVEDTVAMVLSNVGGVGVVEAGWSLPGGRSVVEIYGTAGACLVDYDTGALRYLTADQPIWRSHDEGGPNRFEREIAHFADAVRGLQPLAVTGEDGARAVELCAELARQSDR
jgi:predicted dehydrogenase